MIGLSRLSIGIGSQGPSSGGAPPALILDSLSAGAAYSTRKLRTAYAGAAIRVRRSSDNVEADIGFSGNSLDTAALTAHVGANSGFVVTWYDQTTNGRNITQSTQANQPRIVNAGTIDVQNSKPSLFFNGTSHHLFNSSPFMYAAGSATIFAVASGTATIGACLVGEGSTASNNPVYFHGQQQNVSNDPDSAVFYRNDAGTTFVSTTTAILSGVWDNILRPVQWDDTGSSVNVFRNGASGTAQAYTRSGALTLNNFCIGAGMRTTTSFFFQGFVSEVIVIAPGVNSTTRATIDVDQSAAFPI